MRLFALLLLFVIFSLVVRIGAFKVYGVLRDTSRRRTISNFVALLP
jgi:hypothetical protein